LLSGWPFTRTVPLTLIGCGVGVGLIVGLGVGVGVGVGGRGESFGMVMLATLVLVVLPAWSVQVPVAVWLYPGVLTVVMTVALTGPEVASVQANVTTTG
jgi:hypothetical protein